MSHDTWLEHADLYAVGALDGEELARLEAHLAAGCAECQARIAETRTALAELPASLPPAEPSPALRARVMERIALESPARPVPARPARPASRVLWWAGWAGLAAAAALLLVLNAQLSATREEMRALQARIEGLQGELADREATVRLLSDPAVRYVSLAGLAPSPRASAWLLWHPVTRRGILLARDLPPLPEGRAYELWAIAGSAPPVPAGVFTVDRAGRGVLRPPVLPPDRPFDTFAVSLEPAGGVPAPTGPLHLAGKL
jgi:anti-sigma-K factor RskA